MNKSNHHLHLNGAGVSKEIVSRLKIEEEINAITCYENKIPAFVEAELERLYGNLYSSLPHLRIYGKLTEATNTYVVRDGDEIITLFLFQHRRRQVTVINEGMTVSAKELRLFSDYIFSRYKSALTISFNAVEAPAEQIPFPHQRLSCPCDIVLDLPEREEEYLASLGKHIRHNIKRSMTRLPIAHPSFRMDFYDSADVKENHIRDIISLNKVRMDRVKKVYKRDHDEVQKVIDLSRHLGMVGVMTIDGQVCGGSVGYKTGKQHLGRIISHDPKYDKYSIGTLCIFLCIRECIARGYKQFNFMSGNNEYKSLLGGIPRNLEQIFIYRSRATLMLNLGLAAKMLYLKILHHARLRIQLELSTLNRLKLQGKLDRRSKTLFFILDNLRTLKDRLSGPAKRD
jgi:hypothetical protein